MEMFIFFAGLIITLIVSSGLAISILFLGDMNPDSKQNRRVNYTLSDLKDNEKMKKLIAEVKDYKEKVSS
jgi:uncharacterized membrane protein